MCVCDLGGVYIKPTRPWVVVPLPSSLANVHSSSCRPSSSVVVSSGRRLPVVCLSSAVICRPVVCLSSSVPSCHLSSVVCHLSSCRPVVCCRLASVVQRPASSVHPVHRLAAASLRPSFAPSRFPYSTRSSLSLSSASLLVFLVVAILTFPALILQS